MKAILIVEDNLTIQKYCQEVLGGLFGLQPYSAFTVEEASRLYKPLLPRLAAVCMDGCVGSIMPNTLELTKRIRAEFDGPMLAISADTAFQSQLGRAGCDFACAKREVPLFLASMLGITVGMDRLPDVFAKYFMSSWDFPVTRRSSP